MSDQGKWFKLWESALDDQDLENLTIHEWFCWARFGTYIKKHGKDGKIRIRYPATALQNLLRLESFGAIQNMLKRFPNYTIEEGQNVTANVTNATVTLNIKCLNWSKYQGDFSGDRVRKHRQRVTANVTAQEEKRRDVEENRQEENISGEEMGVLSRPYNNAYEQRRNEVGAEALQAFIAKWKSRTRAERESGIGEITIGLKLYKLPFATSDVIFKQIMGDPNVSDDSKGTFSYAAQFRAKREAEALRVKASSGEISTGVRDMPDVQVETGGEYRKRYE